MQIFCWQTIYTPENCLNTDSNTLHLPKGQINHRERGFSSSFPDVEQRFLVLRGKNSNLYLHKISEKHPSEGTSEEVADYPLPQEHLQRFYVHNLLVFLAVHEVPRESRSISLR
jgi:hypothetical protein